MLNLNKHTKTKPEAKPTLIFKHCSYVRAYHCAQLLYTTQHRTVLIILPLIIQTIITARMISTGGEGDNRIDVRQLPAVAEKRATGHRKSTRCQIFYKVV